MRFPFDEIPISNKWTTMYFHSQVWHAPSIMKRLGGEMLPINYTTFYLGVPAFELHSILLFLGISPAYQSIPDMAERIASACTLYTCNSGSKKSPHSSYDRSLKWRGPHFGADGASRSAQSSKP